MLCLFFVITGGNKLAASMKRAILEVVVSGAASTRQQVERLLV